MGKVKACQATKLNPSFYRWGIQWHILLGPRALSLCLLLNPVALHKSPEVFQCHFIRLISFRYLGSQCFPISLNQPKIVLILSFLEPSLNHWPCVWLLCIDWIENFPFSFSQMSVAILVKLFTLSLILHKICKKKNLFLHIVLLVQM